MPDVTNRPARWHAVGAAGPAAQPNPANPVPASPASRGHAPPPPRSQAPGAPRPTAPAARRRLALPTTASRVARWCAIVFAVFASAAALAGGAGLLAGLVAPRVFETTRLVLWPLPGWRPYGALLIAAVGLPMVAAAVLLALRRRVAPLVTLIAAAALLVWEGAQLMFVGDTSPLHVSLAGLGLALGAAAGVLLAGERGPSATTDDAPEPTARAAHLAADTGPRPAAGVRLHGGADARHRVGAPVTEGASVRPRRRATRAAHLRTESHGLAVPPGQRSDPAITGLTSRLAGTGEIPMTKADTGPISAVLAAPSDDVMLIADTGRLPAIPAQTSAASSETRPVPAAPVSASVSPVAPAEAQPLLPGAAAAELAPRPATISRKARRHPGGE